MRSNVFRYEVCVPTCSVREKLHTAALHHPDSLLGDHQVTSTDATLEDTSDDPTPSPSDSLLCVTGNKKKSQNV